MSLSKQIDDCQSNLDLLSIRLTTHTKTAQETIDSNQHEVLQRLKNGIGSISIIARNVAIQDTGSSHPQDAQVYAGNCQVCQKEFKGLYFECYNCETVAAAGKTDCCLSCAKSPPCKIGYHFLALRSASHGHWRLKAPLPFMYAFEVDWLTCDICASTMSNPEHEFTWCDRCVLDERGTFCKECTSRGYRCPVKEHPPPVSRLEIISNMQLSKKVDLIPRSSWNTDLTSKQETSLSEQSVQVINCFKKLAQAAENQLDDILEINQAAIELEDEFDALRIQLDNAALKASSAIADTQISLDTKEAELETTKKKVKEYETEMNGVAQKIKVNKEDRTILRVARVATWTGAIFFPPAAILATGMEIGNLALKDRKNQMKEHHTKLGVDVTTHESSIEVIKAEGASLKSALETKETLSTLCKQLTEEVKATKKSLVFKQQDYQILKEAAGAFLQWSENWHSRSDMMVGFTDGDELRDMTKNLITDLLRCSEKAIADICKPLQSLLLEAPERPLKV